MRNKAGSGLSMNMVILLILGLIVIVIIGAIALGKIRFFQSNLQPDCELKGGSCIDKVECTAKGGIPNFIYGCPSESDSCCLGECSKNEGQCVSKETGCSEGKTGTSLFFCDKSDNICCVEVAKW